jgi:hypothetical protein
MPIYIDRHFVEGATKHAVSNAPSLSKKHLTGIMKPIQMKRCIFGLV